MPTPEIDKIMNQLKQLKGRTDVIDGDGKIIVHNKRLVVDASVRITDLLKKINALEQRIIFLESVVGTTTETPTASVTEYRLGNWRFSVSEDGNTLKKECDLNEGLTTTPNWEIREESEI